MKVVTKYIPIIAPLLDHNICGDKLANFKRVFFIFCSASVAFAIGAKRNIPLSKLSYTVLLPATLISLCDYGVSFAIRTYEKNKMKRLLEQRSNVSLSTPEITRLASCIIDNRLQWEREVNKPEFTQSALFIRKIDYPELAL